MAEQLTINPDKLPCCNRVLERSNAGVQFAEDCRDCGLPVDDLLDELRGQAEVATKIKSKFFPHYT